MRRQRHLYSKIGLYLVLVAGWLGIFCMPLYAQAPSSISTVTDPAGDITGVAYYDIIAASVERLAGRLRFTMVVDGTIPSVPGQYVAFVWAVNYQRGQSFEPHQYNVRVFYDPNYNQQWDGVLDLMHGPPTGWSTFETSVLAETVSTTMQIAEIDSPSVFWWQAWTLIGDHAPESGYVVFADNIGTAISYVEISTDTISPNSDGVEDSVRLSYVVSSPCTLSLNVKDASQDTVRRILVSESLTPGSYANAWDGKDDYGFVVAEGSYTLHLAADSEEQTFMVEVDQDAGVYVGMNVEIHVPHWYTAKMEQYDVLNIADVGVDIIDQDLTDYYTRSIHFGGNRQRIYYAEDIGYAHSGNPIRIGSGFWGGDDPPFMVMFHEAGHNWTTAWPPRLLFELIVVGEFDSLVHFNEGGATLCGLYVAEKVKTTAGHFGISPEGYASLMRTYDDLVDRYSTALDDYEAGGCDYGTMNADILDGILLRLSEQCGWEMHRLFYHLFLPEYLSLETIQLAQTATEKITFLICALSVAAQADLRAVFVAWNFPFDDSFSEMITPHIQAAYDLYTTAVEERQDATPGDFAVMQNYPNPFNPGTNIKFQLSKPEQVRIEIFDLLGRRVRILIDKSLRAGYHAVNWDGRDSSGREVASGLYFYRIEAGEFTDSRKMLLLR